MDFKNVFKHFKFSVIQYPRREEKYGIDMPNTVYELADELFDEYKNWFRNNYVVWGHSMGSTVGYEVVKRCEEILHNSPIAFFSSGASAPCNTITSKVRLSIDSDKDFEELMEQYGGIRDELLHNKDFCDYFYPIIRGDMKILSDYRDDEYIKLRCPVRLIEGTEDTCVIDKWKFYTDFDIDVKYHNGGHFFINDHKQEIADYIEKSAIEVISRKTGTSGYNKVT
jgi:Predicted thioesterase involved in non-ribosomal peptide biosynthesis